MAEQRCGQNNSQNKAKRDDFYKMSDSKKTSNEIKPTSLSSHILWNITKALEMDPNMHLKDAIMGAQARLESECDVSAMIPESAPQRHLACAVLAWQQMGHSAADSLCQFISSKKKEQECSCTSSNDVTSEQTFIHSQESKYTKDVHSMSFGLNSIGPVVKLPVETKIVMRMENSVSAPKACKKPKASDNNTKNKIDAACCFDSACVERLTKMDAATTELRMRAGMLAKREAERVELLERAEAAWKDLELGYQRRLTLAEEKEEDLTKQIQKAIEERNGNKNACTSLASQLREKGDKAEKDRAVLSCAEKEVCERACLRLKLSEESAQGDAVLAEHQCRAAQLERDLLFKEEQARRRLLNFQSELESSQTITHETERAMRAELSALREQIAQVSEQLLGEDAENSRIRDELEDLRQEKMGMVEDLEGCKALCDSRMQGKVDELKKKRDQLGELKDKVMDCRCKLPVDVVVEVKRTASLAALCRCTPEEKIMESCSCTSLRSSLLSNLLGDLFSGLQAEMGGTGTQMPCQLLKCLEDKHNWDRASIVKTNLKNYFSQLLIGELDIAIATSIEKYHAKWVGQSCADTSRMIPDPGEAENEGWQERAIERRAQKLATKLAEELFQERADQLTQLAKDKLASGPPPCECKPNAKGGCGKEAAAVYPVLTSGKQLTASPVIGPTTPANTPAYWRQTMQDVTQLRVQIQDLKKESIKKEDLKLMEEKLTKIVQQATGTEKSDVEIDPLANDLIVKKANLSKLTSQKKKSIETNNTYRKGQKNNITNSGPDKNKSYKKLGQTFAINMCMCSHKDPNKVNKQNKILDDSTLIDYKGQDRISKDSVAQISNSVKQTKPINSSLHSRDISTRTNSKSSGQQLCQSNCKCFHKIPSNTSIDKLLETLTKWKSDLNSCEIQNNDMTCNLLPTKEMRELNDKKSVQIDPLLKKVPDIKEESANTSKVSSQSRSLLNKPEQIRSNPSSMYDKESLINNQSLTERPSEIDNDKKHINNKGKSSLDKGVCCNNTSYSKQMHSNCFTPIATESEYMGAINLDKSNEDFCKCLKENEITSDPLKCMPCKCSCKSINTKTVATHNNKNRILSDGVLGNQNKENKNGTHEKESSFAAVSNSAQDNLKNSDIFPCDCGYDIQFLGVTLTDVNNLDKEDDDEMPCDTYNSVKNISLSTDNNKFSTINETNIAKKNLNNNISEKFQSVRDIIKPPHDLNKMKCLNLSGSHKNIVKKDSIKHKENISENFKESKIINTFETNDREKCEKCQLFKRVVVKGEATESCESTPCCDCENKNAFQNEQTNTTKSIDDKSLNEGKGEEEPCVCCNKQKSDETEDLEQNTFVLLEYHLKKKLNEFKESSCNSLCIPPGEEEKLFNTILKRVKQVITESTNKISCKCASEENKSNGSWNRAYGLLQEYLKTKIQRVQCSCEAEVDNDVVLPELLDKVCNLIDNDFQRLKDVCGCKKDETNKHTNDNKQVNFREELPEKDNHTSSKKNEINQKSCDSCSQNHQTPHIIIENNSSQVPDYLGMETKSCDVLETYAKKVQTTVNIQKDRTSADCICEEENVHGERIELNKSTELAYSTEHTRKNKPSQFSNTSFVAFASECACRDIECLKKNDQVSDKKSKDVYDDILHHTISEEKSCGKLNSILNKTIETTKVEVQHQNRNMELPIKTYVKEIHSETNTESFNANEKNKPNIPELLTNGCICKSINCCEKNKSSNDEKIKSFPNKPYIGYTLNCSCDGAFGACVCTKSNFQADSAMDSIMNKYKPNEKYFEKIAYIMKSNATENTNYPKEFLSDMAGDLYLHNILKHKTLYDDNTKQDDETEASFYGNEDIVLKSSRDFYETAHTTTNTFDDNMSLDTDYSNTEPAHDWCECCSQIPLQYTKSDQLKKSIYFPIPLENDIKNNKVIESVSKTSSKCCDCELVPICHVKMLVQNIENKLVNAKCTCDSMIPKVCPIHSTEL